MLTDQDLQKIKTSLKPQFNSINLQFGVVNQKLDKLTKNLKTSVDHLDRRLIDVENGVRRVEQHLSLEPLPPTSKHPKKVTVYN